VVSVERGYDSREFTLVAFGGCGGLHACDIAQELGVRTVIVPQYAGALSALGMLVADAVRDYAAGVLGDSRIEKRFDDLERHAHRESPHAKIERSADLRYRGQSYELNVPWSGAIARFHREHARVYGYSTTDREVEVVTIRVRARTKLPKPHLARQPGRKGSPETRRVWVSGAWRKVPVLKREQLTSASRCGPGLVLDYGSTTLIPQGWRFQLDRAGNLLCSK